MLPAKRLLGYDEACLMPMNHPRVRERDLKDCIAEWRKAEHIDSCLLLRRAKIKERN
jgi:hypothetical protein